MERNNSATGAGGVEMMSRDERGIMDHRFRLLFQPLENPEGDVTLFLDFYNLRLQVECLMEPGRLILDTASNFQSDLEKGNYPEKNAVTA